MQQANPVYETKYLDLIKKIVLKETLPYSCKIVLFGSRAQDKARFGSDIDIGILGLEDRVFSKARRSLMEKIEESIVPYKVDIVNLDQCQQSFRHEALKNAQVWKQD